MIVNETGEYAKAAAQMFFKIGVFKNFEIFTGIHLCWSLFLIEVYKLYYKKIPT